VNARHLRCLFVAIVMIVGLAAAGAAQVDPLPSTEYRPAGGVTRTASDWSGAEGIMPLKPHVGLTAAHERTARAKLPVPLAALFTAVLSTVLIRRALHQVDSPRESLATSLRSAPRRGPPHFSLG
jgi:hypothetical protein